MKSTRGFVLGAALVTLLSACGLIPPVALDDPLALDGETVTAEVGAAAADAGLDPQQVESYTATGTVEIAPFDNLEVDAPVLPDVLNYVLNVASEITVVTETGTYPETITVSEFTIAASVEDADGAADGSASLNGTATYTAASGCTTGTPCTYTLSGGELDSATLSVDGLREILFGGAEPNTAEVTITAGLSSDPALAPGSTIAFVLEVEGSTASDF